MVQGRDWRAFTCSFRSPDGHFSFEIYALSHAHAQMLLDEIRASAVVDGEIQGVIAPGDPDYNDYDDDEDD